jgi:hypothetical protein
MSQYQEIFLKAQACVPSEDTSGYYFQGTGTTGGFDHPDDCLTSYLLFGSPYKTWVSFENVTIPAGATIGKAWLEITSTSNETTTFDLNIYSVIGTATYDCGTHSSMVYGNDSVLWSIDSSWVTDGVYSTPNLTCVIQNIVDDASWPTVGGVDMTFSFEGGTTDTRTADIDGVTLKVYYHNPSGGYGYGYDCDTYDCSISPCGCVAPTCTASGQPDGTKLTKKITATEDDGFYACGSACQNNQLMLGDYNAVSMLSDVELSAQAVAGKGANIWLRFKDLSIPTPTESIQIVVNQSYIEFNCKTADIAGVTDGDVVVDIYIECGNANTIDCSTGTHPSALNRTAGKKTWTINYSWDTVNQVYHATELECLVQERIDYDWTTGDNITFLMITDEALTDSGATRYAYDYSDASSFEPRLVVYYDMIHVGTGGVVVGGAADVSSITNIDGVLVGGAADVTKTVTETPTGGLLAGGTSVETATYNITATSGALVGGSASQTFNDIIEPSGGLTAGTAGDVFAEYNIVTAGGLAAGGSSVPSIDFSYTGSGGALAGSSARLNNIITPIISGGLTAGGLASEDFNDIIEPTGGLTAGTAGDVFAEYNFAVDVAGVLSGGSAYPDLTYNISASDGALAGSSAVPNATYNVTADGGALAGGSALQTFNDIFSPSGGLTAGSTAASNVRYSIPVDGGALLAGSSVPYVTRSVTGSGGLTAGSSAVSDFTYNITAASGSLVGGSALQTFNDIFSPSGGLTAGTAGDAFVKYNVVTAGGLAAGGYARRFKITSPVPTGGLLAGGSVLPDLTYNVVASGGLTAGTSAYYGLNIAAKAHLSADSSLTGYANLIIAATADMQADSSLTGDLQIKPLNLLQELRTYVLADATVSGLIGTRMYPIRLPQNVTLPAITYQRISHEHMHHLKSGTGTARARMQLDCWSYSLTECKQMSEALRGLLHGFTGTMQSVKVFSSLCENEIHLHEPPQDGSDNYLYHIAQDFIILHTESQPDP